MSWIVAVLARWGVPEAVRRPLGTVLLVLTLAIAVVAAWSLWLRAHDAAVIERHDTAREVEAGAARETAAGERVDDALRNEANERKNREAIDNAPKGGTLDPAAHALACQRLRNLGRIPAACRSSSCGGGEASAE
ncbi:hypothetical protein [Croceicoccus sp. YJ47]|uniref:hypothetical protein n=1 Tax=Croceicoccus sp. YJ47 TaxID=2798724 RepID=UPI001921C4FA|nr:hypothetical protein [Croceicoccus sp. YJ47]QQN75050.1 hypothetical protein JD971_04960 [Croceicoccus sp. YJ47]